MNGNMTETFGANDSSATSGTTVTSGTAGAIGSYTQIAAATSFKVYTVTVIIHPTSQDHEAVLHLGIGTGTPTDILQIPFHGNSDEVHRVTVPFTIAEGTEISAAITSTDASSTAEVILILSNSRMMGVCTEATLLGSSGGVGTAVDCGAVAHTKTAWFDLTTSSPHDINLILLNIGYNNNNSINPAHDFLVDVGVDDTVVVENILHQSNVSEFGWCHALLWVPRIIPGSAINVRAQSGGTTSLDRVIDISAVGFNVKSFAEAAYLYTT